MAGDDIVRRAEDWVQGFTKQHKGRPALDVEQALVRDLLAALREAQKYQNFMRKQLGEAQTRAEQVERERDEARAEILALKESRED